MTEQSATLDASAKNIPATDADVNVVFEDGSTIGESLLWVQNEGALYWVDIKAPTLYRYDLASDARQEWSLPSDCGAFALIADAPAALVALRDGLNRLDFASGALSLVAPAPFDQALFRFNEGAVDANGRFWVGVMFDPQEKTSEKRKERCIASLLPGACSMKPTGRRSIMEWLGVRTGAPCTCRIARSTGSTASLSILCRGSPASGMCSRRSPRNWAYPMARLWI